MAVQAHTYEQVVESTELTQLKLDTEVTRDVETNKDEGAGRQGTYEAMAGWCSGNVQGRGRGATG